MHLGGKVLCFDNIGKLISIIDVNTNMEYSNIVVPDETVSVECIPGTFGTTGDDFDRNTFFLDQASYFDENTTGVVWMILSGKRPMKELTIILMLILVLLLGMKSTIILMLE